MTILKQQDIEAKTRQIVDTLFDKERLKIQTKLDNLEVYHNKQIKFFQLKLNNSTTDRQKKMWMQKLKEISDIENYKKYLLDALESYN